MKKTAAWLPVLLLISVVLIVGLQKSEQPSSPVASAAPAPFTKLPSSIQYTKVAEDEHLYKISGIYNFLGREEMASGMAPVYRNLVPACRKFDIDYASLVCTLVTTVELPISELAYSMDEIARLGGEMPTFTELEARDLPKSPLGETLSYVIQQKAPEGSEKLEWLDMPEDGSVLRLPLDLGSQGAGTLFIVPATAHCMVHSIFVIRVLDSEGRVIWQEGETAYGTIQLALQPPSAGQAQAFYLFRNNHGIEDDFFIHPEIKTAGNP